VEHAHEHVEHAAVFAEQTRNRLLHEAKTILHERGLDVPHPNLVGRKLARVFVLTIDYVDAAALVVLSGPPRRDRIVRRSGDIRRARVGRAHPDTARAGDLFVSDAKHLRADFADEVLGPHFDVARRAAFDEQHERPVAEASEKIGWLAGLVDQTGELTNEFFDAERTDVIEDRGQLIGFDGYELPDAGFDRLRQRLFEPFEKELALQRARGGIALERLVQVLIERIRAGAATRRHAKADCRFAVELRFRKLDIEGH